MFRQEPLLLSDKRPAPHHVSPKSANEESFCSCGRRPQCVDGSNSKTRAELNYPTDLQRPSPWMRCDGTPEVMLVRGYPHIWWNCCAMSAIGEWWMSKAATSCVLASAAATVIAGAAGAAAAAAGAAAVAAGAAGAAAAGSAAAT